MGVSMVMKGFYILFCLDGLIINKLYILCLVKVGRKTSFVMWGAVDWSSSTHDVSLVQLNLDQSFVLKTSRRQVLIDCQVRSGGEAMQSFSVH